MASNSLEKAFTTGPGLLSPHRILVHQTSRCSERSLAGFAPVPSAALTVALGGANLVPLSPERGRWALPPSPPHAAGLLVLPEEEL